MAEPQTATCPQCSLTISPEDTIVFGFGILGHLDCRQPRVLSAEERTLLFIYCRDHQVAEGSSAGRPPRRRARRVAGQRRRRVAWLGGAPSSTRGSRAPRCRLSEWLGPGLSR